MKERKQPVAVATVESSLDAMRNCRAAIPSYLSWVIQAARYGQTLCFAILKGMRALRTTAQACLEQPTRNARPAGHDIDGDLCLLSLYSCTAFLQLVAAVTLLNTSSLDAFSDCL